RATFVVVIEAGYELRNEAGQRRYKEVLLELAALDKWDTEESLRRIITLDAQTLGVERVNWWSLQSHPPRICCEEAYQLSTGTYERGAVLYGADYPRYFQSLLEEQLIVAHDAHSDARTSEFIDSYLQPLGIRAMLDIPVWVAGRLAGVLCHEWVGS